MDRPTWYPFRDAAMRADASDLRTDRPHDARGVGADDVQRERIVTGERGVVAHAEPPVERRRFSLGATFLGWCVAAFFTLVLAAALAGILAYAGYAEATTDGLTSGDAGSFAIGNLVGYLVIAFLAYLIGGYAAGRISLWDGAKHGMLTVAWGVLFAVLAVAGAWYFANVVDLSAYIPAVADLSTLGAWGIASILLSLAAMLGGAALGGRIGERYHDRAHGAGTRRMSWRTRGRPL